MLSQQRPFVSPALHDADHEAGCSRGCDAGAQVTNELVRQLLEQGGLYSLDKPIGDMKFLTDMRCSLVLLAVPVNGLADTQATCWCA